MLGQLVDYYREFNKEVISVPDDSLAMLAYVTKYGDENLALYEHRKTNKEEPSEELKLREVNKYSLYTRFDSIVFDDGIIDLGQS